MIFSELDFLCFSHNYSGVTYRKVFKGIFDCVLMVLELTVLSAKKGSNPGGLCRVNNGRAEFEGYVKYVFGSKLPRSSSLEADHQPIYEAITFELARRIGLKVPQFYVLINSGHDVKIADPHRVSCKDHSGRKYYFVSKMMRESKGGRKEIDDFGRGVVDAEKPYLELLQIDDILGKRQNYIVDIVRGSVYYVDLGCSFVHAKEGFIHLPNRLRKVEHKNGKKSRCHLKNKSIVKLDDVGATVNLGEIVSTFESITLPTLNPIGRAAISSLLHSEEVEEIREYIAHGFCENLKTMTERGLLVSD